MGISGQETLLRRKQMKSVHGGGGTGKPASPIAFPHVSELVVYNLK